MNQKSLGAQVLIALSILGLVLFPQMFHTVAGTTLWGSPTAIETHAMINILDASFQASNGTMWLAWQTNRYRGDSLYDIAYKTYTNGVWSTAARLTTGGINAGAALAQLSNGTILLFYASKPASSYQIYYQMYNPTGWSSPIQASTTSLNDTGPAVAVGRDGTLWLLWTRTDSSCAPSCTDVHKQLFYKTLKLGVWSAETQLTNDTNQNLYPSITVGKDNIVRVTWSKGLGSLANYQLYYKTNNGGTWSSETKIPVATATDSDEHSSIIQDRNGTIWLFWARRIPVQPASFFYVLYCKFSYDGGTTWLPSSEIQLTNTANTVDSTMPAAVQSSFNKSIWIFYTTDPQSDQDIYALISSPISPVHDVTITGVTTSSWYEYAGGMPSIGESAIVSFTVTVLNRGDQSEIVTVSLALSNASSISLGTKQNLATPGGSVNLIFSRNMTLDRLGWYTAVASVAPLLGETVPNQADNNITYTKNMRLLPWGDVDQDGNVNIQDVSVFFFDFGFTPATPSRWNPVCDINNSGVIDIIDTGVAVKNFGLIS